MSNNPNPTDVQFSFLSPPQAPDEIGRLGEYRVLQLLGEGSMGLVFLAEETQIKRKVALKVMKSELAIYAEHRARFLREARTAASVEHEYIIPIFCVDEDHGIPFITMPLLKGESLDSRLKRLTLLPFPEVLRIGSQIAEGLAVAHDAGLIHRDVKPGNIWLEAPHDRVKILDFGLARSLESNEELTRTGALMGTPAYMSPEQASGERVDYRADLFALGIVLYQMSTGVRPFSGNSAVAVLMAVTNSQPPSPKLRNPSLPKPFADLVMQLLDKDRERRPRSGHEVAARLQQMVGLKMPTRTESSITLPPAAGSTIPTAPYTIKTIPTPTPPTPTPMLQPKSLPNPPLTPTPTPIPAISRPPVPPAKSAPIPTSVPPPTPGRIPTPPSVQIPVQVPTPKHAAPPQSPAAMPQPQPMPVPGGRPTAAPAPLVHPQSVHPPSTVPAPSTSLPSRSPLQAYGIWVIALLLGVVIGGIVFQWIMRDRPGTEQRILNGNPSGNSLNKPQLPRQPTEPRKVDSDPRPFDLWQLDPEPKTVEPAPKPKTIPAP